MGGLGGESAVEIAAGANSQGVEFGAFDHGGQVFVEDGVLVAVGESGAGILLVGVYYAAALALQGVEEFEVRFQQAIHKGRALFKELNLIPGIEIKEFEHGSNIFPLFFDSDIDIPRAAHDLQQRGIYVYPDEGSDRYTQLTLNTTILRRPNENILETFIETLNKI